MVFSSLPFLFVFMPLFFLLYYLTPTKGKNWILLFFSLIFYAWGEPVYIILMIVTSFVNYLGALLLAKKTKGRKWVLIFTIAISLGLLGFYKYGNFVIDNLNQWFSLGLSPLDLALPIGISFYTFQAISYTVDVYRKEVSYEKNFFTLLTYISMFPQLIAGPIVRYQTINKELHNRNVTFPLFASGLFRFLRGLGKKVLLANNIGLLFTLVQESTAPSVLMQWLGILAFALQIYFDFSGYSDMGIGLGKMLGFTFLENFNYPYIAQSITDFWRRWHISLSTFFKDYVYIPLGGNRKGTGKTVRNILIVWALTGLWHGAAWNFILWGLYYGILLLLEKFVLKKALDKCPRFLKHLYALFFILLGWAIFAFDDTKQLVSYFTGLFGGNHLPLFTMETLYLLKNYALLLLLGILLSTPLVENISKRLAMVKRKPLQIVLAIGGVLLYAAILLSSVAYLVDSAYNPFLYFRF